MQTLPRLGLFMALLLASLATAAQPKRVRTAAPGGPRGPLAVTAQAQDGAFPLVQQNRAAAIWIDAADASVVAVAAEAVAADIALISGTRPAVQSTAKAKGEYVVLAGTIGHSQLIDQLIRAKKLDVAAVRGKWESYKLVTISAPLPGVKQALVIVGSDRRGTAYGLFELSRRAGVSPWVWWADVTPAPRQALYVLPGTFTQGEPSVKYRGIFINDEDWGLFPWASRTQDPDVKNVGPHTYARVFELLLRLRANLIWPAMHDSTKAFWYYRDNPKMADKYGIVMGSTHCDMMLRSNTFEWQKNFAQEYGTAPGPYRYDTNKAQVSKYWDDRVTAVQNYEAMYTVGMRGVRDGSIVGPTTQAGKIALVDTVIHDQREMMRRHFGATSSGQQIFCPYKEVLSLYQGGLQVPDDVTLVWTDDNFGYIRQLSTPAEQQRSGASGIYYHLSYLGGPHDYLWLTTTAPTLVAYEMNKAYQFGANRFWVVNVGDIKPAEMDIQFFMDMAWDARRWTPATAHTYAEYWAAQTFGPEVAPAIAAIKQAYYQLAQSGKPEHLGILRFEEAARQERLAAYARLVAQVAQVKSRIPARLQNAFFELVEYPVKGAALMNQKIFYAQLSLAAATIPAQALTYSQQSAAALAEIKALTAHYTTDIEKGKWNGIITHAPRNLAVYGMPRVANPEVLPAALRTPPVYDRRYLDTTAVVSGTGPGLVSRPATGFSAKHEVGTEQLVTVAGLGLGGQSLTRYPFTGPSYEPAAYAQAPYVEYQVALPAGAYQLSLKFLPTHAINKGRNLGVAVAVDGGTPQFADLDNPREDRGWKVNLLRGYSEAQLPVRVGPSGQATVRVYLLDTGLALSRLDLTPQ